MGNIFDDVEIEEVQYEQQDLDAAIFKIYAETGSMPYMWDKEAIDLAKKLYKQRVSEASKDIKQMISDAEEKKLTNKTNTSKDDGIIKVDFAQMKKKTIGNNKTLKVIIKKAVPAVLAFLLLTGSIKVVLMANTKINEYQGSKDSEVYIYDHDGEKWYGSHYNTWYNFRPMGEEITNKALSEVSNSSLDFEELLMIGYGQALKDVTKKPNTYGDDSHYFLSDGLYDYLEENKLDDGTIEYTLVKKGWAVELYNAIVETAQKNNIELPSLEELIAKYRLGEAKFEFTSTGDYKITPFVELSAEEREYYSSYEGMLSNLIETSDYYSYVNGIQRGGAR